jgi:polysaccharide deacetylase family protein (PEP-CTERM system associated)
LLEKHESKATFFVLGDVAKHYPNLVKEMADAGHEIGVHSHAHYQLFKLTPDTARADTIGAKAVIEDVIGKRVVGYRAPAFSVTPHTSWSLPMLAELGFEYDSSIMPIKARRYGWPNFPKDITRVTLGTGKSIVEFPMSVTKFLGKKIPCCGGGPLRQFPFWFTKRFFADVSANRPVNVYVHPYEIDTEPYPAYYSDALRQLSWKRRLAIEVFRINKTTMFAKLDRLLALNRFDTCKSVIDAANNAGTVGTITLEQALIDANKKRLSSR